MTERTSVVAISSDHPETVTRLARLLGTNKLRRKIFNAVYGRGSLPKSKKQLIKAAGIKLAGNMGQQVQNALDHLQTHHLIVRIENDGSVKDGSRYLYKKDPTVRSIRNEILRFADNKRAAAKVATKQRPAVRVKIESGRSAPRKASRRKKLLTVLYLTADPDKAKPLRVDAEMRGVQEAIRGSSLRDNVKLEYRPAADLNSLIQGLNDHRPQVVHFSGHGNASAIATDKGKVGKPSLSVLSFDLLGKALAATDAPPQVVVLNSCSSSNARKALATAKIVIAMGKSISDIAATAFAVKFYAAIASGQSVKAAFAQGKVAIEMASIIDVDTPELICAPGVNAQKVILT